MRRALCLLPPLACVTTLVSVSQPDDDSRSSRDRFFTDREGARPLELPDEDEGFFFMVYGDRTGGRPEGVRVLERAVAETNLLGPDLVMTVGDLIQGYNTTEPWMAEMREYRGVMAELDCPWYPVAGNHDVYWRGPDRPEGEHDAHYEQHFGPLWYAFEHKDCWFIALYSDEGDPRTGEKNFGKAACQVMSERQTAFLRSALQKAAGAKHVFVFLHHPRWLGGRYGDDWDRVHELLAAAGNVTAVFAGHIHKMRYDGVRDGIEYVTLATTGGGQSAIAPRAGYLDHVHVVSVTDEGIRLCGLPVGQALDVRAITGEVSDHAARLGRSLPRFSESIPVDADGRVDARAAVLLDNPLDVPVKARLELDAGDARWSFEPPWIELELEAGATHRQEFRIRRPAGLDRGLDLPQLSSRFVLPTEGASFDIPARLTPWPLEPRLALPPRPTREAVLATGSGAALAVSSSRLPLPDGPLTLECWLRAERFGDRVGLVTKTESSEYGIFVNEGRPAFLVHLDGRYEEVGSELALLETGRWTHVAGVFDGAELRLYVDGSLVKARPGSGSRRTNALPLMVGADVGSDGSANSFFEGEIDELRLSSVARYEGPSFEPARRHETDASTYLLLPMDARVGPWVPDHSGRGATAEVLGAAEIR